MDYPLENLGPERFQQICQSLLVREHPSVQCFPIAQPDGGRDAISTIENPGGKFVVFQVKFARRPHAETDPHKWLVAVMEKEAPKIKGLIPKGAFQYYLITNISGTAHLGTGSIDRLNNILKETLGIPSVCWWRDDVNRRLDNAWDLKWSYPEVMTGPDFLRAILEAGIAHEYERRAATLRAFLTHQFRADEEVRFKQVELQNKLLDLFVDVPIAVRDPDSHPRAAHLLYAVAAHNSALADIDETESTLSTGAMMGGRWYTPHEPSIGAATLFLDPIVQASLPHAVLEGAPGQGKSTIAQYICQVHRMRLLQESEGLNYTPEPHRAAPPRLPIRVDLRDFATWLSRRDPFGADENASPPTGWQRSLEGFLSALISTQSGGARFTTDDLIAVARISSILIVFDGLDEVADTAKRREVVEELNKGVQRLKANAAALQTIVTSRPAAFANSPGMPVDQYPCLHLLSLTRRLVNDYADRWLRARRLDAKEASEFKKILKEKLDQPHLRDLARNPMQLTILLSLIHTKGASLPDKRTALYDDYIDLFLNRESQKSAIVRDHRILLLDIHQYLAWLLHSQAERGADRGSIAQDRLLSTVTDYLAQEGHPTDLAAQLFTGMLERVLVLVSRVQGTYEFEVQTLREYFAARYLHDTAPYSPPGKEQRGTKPDRFAAIARNFYWSNVTRFFAGCYTKGELADLAERLEELAGDDDFKRTTHPRLLAVMLLADWVFAQNPKSVQRVLSMLLSGNGLRGLLASGPYTRRRASSSWQPYVLPSKSGREELVQKCFDILASEPPADYGWDLTELLCANGSRSELGNLWYARAARAAGSERFIWLNYGVTLGTLNAAPLERVAEVVREFETDARVLGALYRARRLDFIERSEEIFDAAIDGILDGTLTTSSQRIESVLDSLSHGLEPARYALAFRQRAPGPLADLIVRATPHGRLQLGGDITTATESYTGHGKCMALVAAIDEEVRRPAIDWATEIGPWDRIIEVGREIWGERWALYYLADVAAGIRSNSERCSDAGDLLDRSQHLARRVRHARLRSASRDWWARQLSACANEDDRVLVALVAMTWARPRTLVSLQESLDAILGGLTNGVWHKLAWTAHRAMAISHLRGQETFEAFSVERLSGALSLRGVSALALRATADVRRDLYRRFLVRDPGGDEVVLQFVQSEALDPAGFSTDAWRPDLERIRMCYSRGMVYEPYLYGFRHGRSDSTMPLEAAVEVADHADRYPGFLVYMAQEACRQAAARKVVPVAHVAERDQWFASAGVQPRLH